MEKFISPEQAQLVKQSYAKLQPLSEEAGILFYARLFELEPGLRPMFSNDIREQGKKLLDMLGLTVEALDNFDEFLPAVRESGVRHSGYGAERRHYDLVAEALWWTFEQALDDEFTPETKNAWIMVYDKLARTMQEAAGQSADKPISR